MRNNIKVIMVHATNDSLEAQLEGVSEQQHIAHDERVEAADISVVRKADFEAFKRSNKTDHEEILQRVDALKPLLELTDPITIKYIKDGVELKKSTDNVVKTWKGRVTTIVVFLGLVAVVITIVNGARDFIIDVFLKIK